MRSFFLPFRRSMYFSSFCHLYQRGTGCPGITPFVLLLCWVQSWRFKFVHFKLVQGAVGVVVSHPLSVREALGSISSSAWRFCGRFINILFAFINTSWRLHKYSFQKTSLSALNTFLVLGGHFGSFRSCRRSFCGVLWCVPYRSWCIYQYSVFAKGKMHLWGRRCVSRGEDVFMKATTYLWKIGNLGGWSCQAAWLPPTLVFFFVATFPQSLPSMCIIVLL